MIPRRPPFPAQPSYRDGAIAIARATLEEAIASGAYFVVEIANSHDSPIRITIPQAPPVEDK